MRQEKHVWLRIVALFEVDDVCTATASQGIRMRRARRSGLLLGAGSLGGLGGEPLLFLLSAQSDFTEALLGTWWLATFRAGGLADHLPLPSVRDPARNLQFVEVRLIPPLHRFAPPHGRQQRKARALDDGGHSVPEYPCAGLGGRPQVAKVHRHLVLGKKEKRNYKRNERKEMKKKTQCKKEK